MPTFSLRQAAAEARTSKSTILRAINSGRLSASRTEDGGYAIDPAELFRVYPPDRTAARTAGQDAPASGQDAPASGQDAPDTVALRIRNAELETQIATLRELVEAERRRADASERRSDQLHQLMDRLALAPPAPAAEAPADQGGPLWRAWRWMRAAS
jgi:hypothetical protein